MKSHYFDCRANVAEIILNLATVTLVMVHVV